jgi:hypothetical protein
MTLDDFRQSLTTAKLQAEITLTLALADFSGMPSEIGRERPSSTAARSFSQAFHLHG